MSSRGDGIVDGGEVLKGHGERRDGDGEPHKPRHPAEPATTAFAMTLAPHSYRVFRTGR